MTEPDDLNLTEWVAFGDWVAEVCPEQLEEPEPLFSCDNAANARQVVSIHNELVARIRGLKSALAEAAEDMQDMRGYVPDYFAEKWGHDEAIAKARVALRGDSEGSVPS